MRQKTCKNKDCKSKFTPDRQMQTTCDYSCAIAFSNQLREKREKNKKKEARAEVKKFNNNDITKLKKKAEEVCNKYIRLRDKKEPCISCLYEGNNRQWHAGHYKPKGGFSGLRYNELNIHKQCSICNNHLSGNLVPYRDNLIEKIGQTEVDKLETGDHIKRWTKEELHVIIEEYRFKIKELESK